MKVAEYFEQNMIGHCPAGDHMVKAKLRDLTKSGVKKYGKGEQWTCPKHWRQVLTQPESLEDDFIQNAQWDTVKPTVCAQCNNVILQPTKDNSYIVDNQPEYLCNNCIAKLKDWMHK